MVDYGVVFASELVGTMLLIILGNGIVYNLIGKKTMGSNAGWLAGSFGWMVAVLVGVLVSSAIATYSNGYGGGSLNPAVSIAQMIAKGTNVTPEIGFTAIAAELVGAALGQMLLNLLYINHAREIGKVSFGAHSCTPTHAETSRINFLIEFVATAVLVVAAVFALGKIAGIPAGVGPLLVGFIILAIALGLGGLTGYAINPARDAMPRLVYMGFHKLMKFEGSAVKAANWRYGWIPLVSPAVAGAVIGGFMAI